MSKTPLAELIEFTDTDAYRALTPQQQSDYFRNDATGYGYAWGRIDQGHAPVVSLNEAEAPTMTATAWTFGHLYARMLLELNDQTHPRNWAGSVQSAWDIFAATGCPDGSLPQHLS